MMERTAIFQKKVGVMLQKAALELSGVDRKYCCSFVLGFIDAGGGGGADLRKSSCNGFPRSDDNRCRNRCTVPTLVVMRRPYVVMPAGWWSEVR